MSRHRTAVFPSASSGSFRVFRASAAACAVIGLAVLASLTTPASAESTCETLGSTSSEGLKPILVVRSAVAGKVAVVTLTDLPADADDVYIGFSRGRDCLDLEAEHGRGAVLVPRVGYDDRLDPPFVDVKSFGGSGNTRYFSKRVSGRLAGKTVHVQAFVREDGRWLFSNAVSLDVRSEDDAVPVLSRSGNLPVAVYGTAAAHDPESGSTYLFGGRASSGYLGNVVRVTPGGPIGSRVEDLGSMFSPRYGAVAIWDPVDRAAWVLGGLDAPFPRLDDIHVFEPGSGGAPTMRAVGERLPGPVGSASAVWADGLDRGYVFGGVGSDGRILALEPRGSRLVTVIEDRLPDTRIASCAVWDPRDGVAYVLGGFRGGVPTDEILRFDPAAPAGSRVTVLAATLPYVLSDGAAVWHAGEGVALVRGFVDAPSTLARFDPDRMEVTTRELGQAAVSTRMVVDDVRGEIFSFGGRRGDEALDGVWRFDASTGNVRALDRLSTGRSSIASCVDPTTGDFYCFGGRAATGAVDEIVVVSRRSDAREQVRVLDVPLPTARLNAAAAWDPVRRKAYVFGGQESFIPNLRQILELDPFAPGGPTLEVVAHLDHPVAGAVAAWEDTTGDILVFGGKSAYGGNVLRFDPDSRTVQVTAARMPRDVVRPSLVDTGDALYLFGGIDRDPVDQVLRYDTTRPEGDRFVAVGETLPVSSHSIAAYWNDRDGVAYLLGGVGAPRAVVRFDPAATAGSRFDLVATLPVDVVGSAVSFEGDLPLPVLVGSSVDGFADAVTVMSWIGR